MESRFERNIPAYAGKTQSTILHGLASAEHPRVCGENFSITKTDFEALGTSPRMRGKLAWSSPVRAGFRNIPAYAGKTDVIGEGKYFTVEHPRVCGENNEVPFDTVFDLGTSPRMRGKHVSAEVEGLKNRNIPAYAGKTDLILGWFSQITEHPRVCGENGKGTLLRWI